MKEQKLKKALLKWAAKTPEIFFVHPSNLKEEWRKWKFKEMEDVVEFVADGLRYNEELAREEEADEAEK